MFSSQDLFYSITIIFALSSLVLSFLVTQPLIFLAKKLKLLDDPSQAPSRKSQKNSIPLLAGSGFVLISLVLSAVLVVIFSTNDAFKDQLTKLNFNPLRYISIGVSIMILLLAGFIDDKKKSNTIIQFCLVALSVFIATQFAGLRVEVGDKIQIPFISSELVVYGFTLFWLLLCTATTKFLDGLDGLVSTVGVVSLLAIASVSLFDRIQVPFVGLLSLVWAAGITGFLPFNFPSAKTYMGEGASLVIGFMIGVFSILSSAKILTATSVLGFFIFDLAIVWLMRLKDRRNPFTSADRLHWHHRLLDIGLDKQKVLFFTTILLLIFTHIGLIFTQLSWWIVVFQAVIVIYVTFIYRQKLDLKLRIKKPPQVRE
jgi:UDP-GlcNAc:undecaprenyl-phosphate/decaprenyl-phosphate GlcNAc-1-phosphate transferase